MLFEQFSVSRLKVKAQCIIVVSNRWTSRFQFHNGRSRLCSSLEKKSNYSCCRKLARILKNIFYVVIEIITNGTTSLCIIISNAPTAHALSSAPASQHACAYTMWFFQHARQFIPTEGVASPNCCFKRMKCFLWVAGKVQENSFLLTDSVPTLHPSKKQTWCKADVIGAVNLLAGLTAGPAKTHWQGLSMYKRDQT